MKFLNDINTNQNELQNMVIHNSSSAPSIPIEGQTYYNTTNHVTYTWNGTSWIPLNRVYTGTCATAGATVAKTVTLGDSTYTPQIGDLFAIKFTNGNSVGSPTLSINGSTAYSIFMNGASAGTTTFTLASDALVMLYFDGGRYHAMGSQRTTDTDTDTWDRVSWQVVQTAGVDIQGYKIVWTDTDGKLYPLTIEAGTGTTKTISTRPFTLGLPMFFRNVSTAQTGGTTSSAYLGEGNISAPQFTYTSNSSAFTVGLPIYLKGTIDASGKFVLDNSSYTAFMTQTLPSTDDGYVYVYLGFYYTTDGLRLSTQHPAYQYKNGGIRLYQQDSSGGSGLPILTKPYSGTDGYAFWFSVRNQDFFTDVLNTNAFVLVLTGNTSNIDTTFLCKWSTNSSGNKTLTIDEGIKQIITTWDSTGTLISTTDVDLMPLSGGTFTGQVVAQSNTSYTTSQIRNIKFKQGTTSFTTSELAVGEIGLLYI